MNILLRDALLAAIAVTLMTAAPIFGVSMAFVWLLRPLPLFLLGLKHGSLAALFAATITALMINVAFPHPQGLITFFTISFPTFALLQITLKALLIKKHAPAELNVEAVGIVLMFAAFLAFMSFMGVMGGMFQFDIKAYSNSVHAIFEQAYKILEPMLESELKNVAGLKQGLMNASVIIIPCSLIVAWMIMMLASYSLAWRIAPKFGIVIPKVNFLDTRLPFLSVLLIGIGFALTYGGDMMRVVGFALIASLAIPFICQGLAVVHTRVQEKSYKRFALIGFYALTLLTGWTIPILFFIGLADPAFALRKKKN